MTRTPPQSRTGDADLTARLKAHPYFTESIDPISGISSFILSKRVASLHKALYFATPSLLDSRSWLWFYAADPPQRRWQVAAVSLDPDRPEIRRFPGTTANGNPLLTDGGRAAYLAIEDGIYRQSVDGPIEMLFRIPDSLLLNRYLYQLCTEITMLADGSAFLLDSHVGNQFIIWLADARTGEATVLRQFDKKHHHTLASPHDPTLFLISQGPGRDPHTGNKIDMDNRIWLMDTTGQRFEPLQADLWFNHNSQACHEWWTSSGQVQYCEYSSGIWQVDPRLPIRERDRSLLWSRPLIHGQCSPDERFLCGDFNPYTWNERSPCSVWLYDREADHEIEIAHHLPRPPLPESTRRAYHTDPHPHFSGDGQLLIYTTTALNHLDVALTPLPLS